MINGAPGPLPLIANRESWSGDQVVVTAVAGREVEVEKAPGGREN